MYKEIISTLSRAKNLDSEQIIFFLEQTAKGKLSLVQQAAILTALNVKGVTARELSFFVKYLSKQMPEMIHFPGAIDICGTGGSGLPRINTSTISAFIISALGIPVAKHGNKAASSRFGSFDLLEALGVNIELGKKELDNLADNLNLALIYARKFHPVMRHFAPVRKELGVPTVFNLIGPLLNPAGTKKQIIGTSFKDKMKLIAETCKKLGKKHVIVACAEDSLDEVTLSGKTFITELKNGKIRSYSISPSVFGIKMSSFQEIKGGNAKLNAQIALDILQGKCKTRHLDLVLINAALALKLAGVTQNLKKAYQLVKDCVCSGKAYAQFLAYKKASNTPSFLLDIVRHKKKELFKRKQYLPLSKFRKTLKPSSRDFKATLLRNGTSLIAEIKKASPSTGLIKKGLLSVSRIAKRYESAGARAISVLTDKKYFQGELNNLKKAEEATYYTPLLCKDFIIDEYQIYEARKFGANAVLLIAGILSKNQIQNYLKVAKSLNMDCLVEVHTEEELNMVLDTDTDIISINNRDLHSFKVDLKTTQRLIQKIPKDKIVVSASGISTKTHLKKLPSKVDAVLVGTSLMKSKDPAKKIHNLIGKTKPLLKICGVRSVREARFCQKLGVDCIGLNFVPTSKRRISYQLASKIIQTIRSNKKSSLKFIGVFQNHNVNEINKSAEHLKLDFVQLSGTESFSQVKKIKAPVLKGISLKRKSDLRKAKRYFDRTHNILLDSRRPGSGQKFNHELLKDFNTPYFLAGGINSENVNELIDLFHPYGIDVASGVETNGRRDLKKIKKIVNLVKA